MQRESDISRVQCHRILEAARSRQSLTSQPVACPSRRARFRSRARWGIDAMGLSLAIFLNAIRVIPATPQSFRAAPSLLLRCLRYASLICSIRGGGTSPSRYSQSSGMSNTAYQFRIAAQSLVSWVCAPTGSVMCGSLNSRYFVLTPIAATRLERMAPASGSRVKLFGLNDLLVRRNEYRRMLFPFAVPPEQSCYDYPAVAVIRS